MPKITYPRNHQGADTNANTREFIYKLELGSKSQQSRDLDAELGFSLVFFFFLLFFLKILFIFSWETQERERQRHRQRENQAPCWEPDVGLDPGTLGSGPMPKAGTKPLSHPGIPYFLHTYYS